MFIGIVLKYLVVVICTSLIHVELKRKWIESFVCGWFSTQLLIILGMSLTSLGNNMTPLTLGAFLLVIGIGGLLVCKKTQTWKGIDYNGVLKRHFSADCLTYDVIIDAIIIVCFLVLGGWIIIHSFFYFDCMTDSYCYGMTRIEMWIKHKSILVNMHSVAKNIFVNEWNGELNGLYYGLMSMKAQGIMFGNAEAYVISLFVLYVAVDLVYPEIKNKLLIVAILLFTPVSFLMAMTVKGDYLYIISMIIGVSYFYKTICQPSKDEIARKFETLASVGYVAYAAGGKITGCALTGMIVAILFVKMVCDKMGVFTILSGMGIGLLGGLRFALNVLYYHNPIERTSCEAFSLYPRNFLKTLLDMVINVWNYDDAFDYDGVVGPIMVDYGSSGRFMIVSIIVAVLLYVYRIIVGSEIIDLKRVLFAVVVLFGYVATILFVGQGGNKEGGFLRIYTPFLFYFALIAIGYLLQYLEKKSLIIFKTFFLLFIVIGAVCSLKISLLPGEVTMGNVEAARMRSSLQRQYATHPYVLDRGATDNKEEYGAQRVIDDITPGSKILCCNYVATIASWLYGENMSNTLWFCYPDELVKNISKEQWDVIAISSEYMGEEYELPYAPDIYPEAVHSWEAKDIENLLKDKYELLKPYPEVCRLWIYVRKE